MLETLNVWVDTVGFLLAAGITLGVIIPYFIASVLTGRFKKHAQCPKRKMEQMGLLCIKGIELRPPPFDASVHQIKPPGLQIRNGNEDESLGLHSPPDREKQLPWRPCVFKNMPESHRVPLSRNLGWVRVHRTSADEGPRDRGKFRPGYFKSGTLRHLQELSGATTDVENSAGTYEAPNDPKTAIPQATPAPPAVPTVVIVTPISALKLLVIRNGIGHNKRAMWTPDDHGSHRKKTVRSTEFATPGAHAFLDRCHRSNRIIAHRTLHRVIRSI